MKFRKFGKNLRVARIVSESAAETQRIGKELARNLSIPGVVMLRGALGTGKTTFTRGLAQGLGLKDPTLVHSPSFTLVNIYRAACPIYHVDLYRLQGERDLYSVGLDDFLGKDGVTVIEWSERLTFKLNRAIEVEFQDAGDDRRLLRIQKSLPEKPARDSNLRNELRAGGRVRSQAAKLKDRRR